jgi:hypothetical protein
MPESIPPHQPNQDENSPEKTEQAQPEHVKIPELGIKVETERVRLPDIGVLGISSTGSCPWRWCNWRGIPEMKSGMA